MELLAIGLAVSPLFSFSFTVLGYTLPQPRTNKIQTKKTPITNNNHTHTQKTKATGACAALMLLSGTLTYCAASLTWGFRW